MLSASGLWRPGGPVRLGIGVLLTCFCLVCLVLASWRAPFANDAFWHLRMGQDLWELGLSPFVEHYSFTHPGDEVIAPAYLFQLFLYLLVKFLGVFVGFFTYKTFTGVALLLTTWFWFRDIKAPVGLAWMLIVLLTLFFLLRDRARPELLSYAMMMLSFIALRRAGIALATPYMLLFGGVLLLWTNYHTPVFGYIIMTGFFIDAAYVQWRQRAPREYWFKWVAWGAVLTGVGFVNPNFTHSIITLLTFSNEWKPLIAEFEVPLAYGRLGATYLVMLLAVLTFSLLLRARRPGWAMMWLLLMYHALLTARMVTPVAIVILALLPWMLQELDFVSWWRERSSKVQWGLIGVTFIATGVAAQSTLRVAKLYANDVNIAWSQYPVEIVDYMQREGLHGKIFNDLDSGGYVLYALAPDNKVFIDSRTAIIYPIELLQRWIRATQQAPALRQEIERYAIDYVLLKNTKVNHHTAYKSGLLAIDYATAGFTLWRTQDAHFPRGTQIEVEPACLAEDKFPALISEYALASELKMSRSPFRTLLAFVNNYAKAADPGQFIKAQEPDATWTDSISRVAAYQAMRHGLYDKALAYIANIRSNEARDLLANAWLRRQRGEQDLAEQVLVVAASTAWPNLGATELIVMRSLIDQVMPPGARNELPAGFVEALDRELSRLGVFEVVSEIRPHDFCADA